MKLLKSGLVLALSAVMVVGAAFADYAPVQEIVAISAPINRWVNANAEVVSPLENNRLLVLIEGQEVALNIGQETVVIDAQTGFPGDLKALEKEDLIYVYYSPAMTKSLPPQSFAGAIVTGVQEDKTIPRWFTVKEVIDRSDEQIRVLNEEGDLIVTLLKEAPITPLKTKQMVRIDDVKVGTELFVWYDIVLTSYPGQTASKKTVIIRQAQEVLNLANEDTYSLGDETMIPLRASLESLGLEVVWNQEIRGALIKSDLETFEILVDKDTFEIGVAPEMKNGRMYMPLTLFKELFGDLAVIEI